MRHINPEDLGFTLLFNYQRSISLLKARKPKSTELLGFTTLNKSLNHHKKNGGGERDRTDDLLRARQALSQLSYTPIIYLINVVGLGGLEPPTSRLSGVRSNQLSYRPLKPLLWLYTSSLLKMLCSAHWRTLARAFFALLV